MNYGFRQWTSRPMSQSHLSFGFQGNNPWSWPHDKTALSFHKVREIDWPFQLSLAGAQSPRCRFRGGRLLTPRTQSASAEHRAWLWVCSSGPSVLLTPTDRLWPKAVLLLVYKMATCSNWHSCASGFTQWEKEKQKTKITIKCEKKKERTFFFNMDKNSTSHPVPHSLCLLRGITVLLSASEPALDVETMWTSVWTRGSVWEWGNRCQLGHQRHLLHNITQYQL